MDYENNNEVMTEEVTNEVSEPVEIVEAEVVDAPAALKAPVVLLGAAVVGGAIAGGVWLFKKGKQWWQKHKEKKAIDAAIKAAIKDFEADKNSEDTQDTVKPVEEK